MRLIKIKKIIVLIALAVLLLSAMLYYLSVLRQFAGGIGTRKYPYRIKTVEQLDRVRNHLKAHFVLVNNLDMRQLVTEKNPNGRDSGWTPIGYYSSRWNLPVSKRDNKFTGKKFAGSFNGRGHTIRNFVTKHSESYIGLFTMIDTCACIESLNIVATVIGGYERVGAIAGSNYGIVSNCKVEGKVYGQGYIGGLVGENYGTISECSSIKGSIKATLKYDYLTPVGGLVGFNGGTVNKCFSQNTVHGGLRVGGLVGNTDKNSVIQNCHADSKIIGDKFLGGLVGDNAGTVSNCYSSIQIPRELRLSFYSVGGFVGRNTGTIANCYSQGDSIGGNRRIEIVGGFAGKNEGIIKKCFSTVSTISGSIDVGGFVGNNVGGTVQCYSTGNVNGSRCVGGFIGTNSGNVNCCYSLGMTNGHSAVGGFIGACWGTVNTCYSSGNVKGTYENVGGFIGTNNNSRINMVYSIGNVQGRQERVGGLIGYSVPQKNKYENYEYWYGDCFYDRISSGIANSQGGTVSTTREMMQASTYIKAGWDLDTLWLLHKLVNQGLPYLRAYNIIPLSCDETGAPLDALLTDEILIRRVEASSSLQGELSYHPDCIRDGRLSTAWVEGSSGDGEGEWIEITFGKPEHITGIIIVNGYVQSEEFYRANNRIRDLNIQAISDADTLVYDVTLCDQSFKEGQKPVGELLPVSKNMRKCRFKINSVYKGSRYHDTCISEIMFLTKKWY